MRRRAPTGADDIITSSRLHRRVIVLLASRTFAIGRRYSSTGDFRVAASVGMRWLTETCFFEELLKCGFRNECFHYILYYGRRVTLQY